MPDEPSSKAGQVHARDLADLAARDRLRALIPRAGHDFASNDYLGLAESTIMSDAALAAIERGVPVGAGGSRLLRGNHPEHESLEAEAAEFFHSESALFMGGGFPANTAIFSTLPQRGDLIVYDELIHASVHDGMRTSRAETQKAAHNDPQAFENAISRWRRDGGTGRPWMAVESLYSMDGDRADLDALVAIADRHDGVLIIDEAHATGVFGIDGRGLGAHLEGRENVISLHTCGKALGAMGGIICLPAVYRDFLINRCRPFIYATAPSPLMAAIVRHALVVCRNEPHRRQQLTTLVAHAGDELATRCGVELSGSQIQPVIVGTDTRAVQLAGRMQKAGYDIRAIRPPTVPEGTSRLRIALTLNVNTDTVSAMAHDLALALKDTQL